jgi:ABC-type sulfate transport system substrate-binding protein
MLETKPGEAKRSELINELLRRHEPVIARAVESALGCSLDNRSLFLNYQDPAYTGWAKVLLDSIQKLALEAAAKQVGIEVCVLVVDEKACRRGTQRKAITRLKMSFSRTAKAVVVSCSLAGSDQVTVDLTLTFYQVQARVLESQYGDDVYMVTVLKPEGIGDLIDEEGTLMEHGKFSFDLTEEIEIGTELEVEITGVGRGD